MAIISAIGRRSWKVRALFLFIYAFLLIGSATMIYPFLLMISGSTKSAVDIMYFDAVPRFLMDDSWLWRKHLESLFNENILLLNQCYDEANSRFEDMEIPEPIPPRFLETWVEFVQEAEIPFYFYQPGALYTPQSLTVPRTLRLFKEQLHRKYGNDIAEINRHLGSEFLGWNSLFVLPSAYLERRQKAVRSPFMNEIIELMSAMPPGELCYFSTEGFYKRSFLKNHSVNIENYNETHGTAYPSYSDIRLPRTMAENQTAAEKKDWELFVREILNLLWIRVADGALPEYHSFLKAKYQNIEALNRLYGTEYAGFEEIKLVDEPVGMSLALSDWESFILGWKDPDTGRMHAVPAEFLRLNTMEFIFRDWLAARYGTPEAMNAALGTSFASFLDVVPPQKANHAAYFQEHRNELRWEFATRNYKAVFEYLVFHGRGLINTVIYCSLAILTALIVNPIAAYAMSRYKLPATYKILLFLMCTMAFPPMVTGIQNFLMLRRLGLLNTFAALILPGMANGYAIFLLKGFFDSLPRELYESAALDGANELVMFWNITMALSKPILAVIALQAFNHAYANFMFAFVVCQDESMWTLMVWLYKLQQTSGQAVRYASLIIAAIPTFLIFLFCQNIIMRGIVVPSEK